MTLTTHHLEFTATARTPLELDDQAGSQLRGAFVESLLARFCANKAAPTCSACPLLSVCPVAALIAPMRAAGEPGSQQRPRPYVTRPPAGQRYQPGDQVSFGLALFGSAAHLFPYVVMAAQGLEQSGMGRPLAANRGRRGLLDIDQIASIHPLSGQHEVLYRRDTAQVHTPGLVVTPADVHSYAATLPTHQITLHVRTPLRLIDNERLVKQLTLRPLIQRLMRRLDELSLAYGDGPVCLDFQTVLNCAEQVSVLDDQTRWVDVVSYSSRQHHRTPIGGLMGSITFAGDLAPLRELLVWGSLIHVGRNAVKGDGWYQIIPAS